MVEVKQGCEQAYRMRALNCSVEVNGADLAPITTVIVLPLTLPASGKATPSSSKELATYSVTLKLVDQLVVSMWMVTCPLVEALVVKMLVVL